MENIITFNLLNEKLNLVLSSNNELTNKIDSFQADYINKIISNPDFKKSQPFEVVYNYKAKKLDITENLFLEISFTIKESYQLEKQIVFYHKDCPLTTIKNNYNLKFDRQLSFDNVYSETISSIHIECKTHDFNKVLKEFFIIIRPSGNWGSHINTTTNDFLAVSYMIKKAYYNETELFEHILLLYDYHKKPEIESIYQLLKALDLYIKNATK